MGFLFSLLKGIFNTWAIHTQLIRQASLARILFAGFFGIFSTSINEILLDAQIKEYKTKISTKPNTYDESQNKTNASPTAPQLPNLHHRHPLSLVLRSFRNLALTNTTKLLSSRPNYIQSPIHHIVTQQSQKDDTYEPIIEHPHTTTFRSQIIFLAHDEPTSWIPSAFNFPSSPSPKLNPHQSSFCFSATCLISY